MFIWLEKSDKYNFTFTQIFWEKQLPPTGCLN